QLLHDLPRELVVDVDLELDPPGLLLGLAAGDHRERRNSAQEREECFHASKVASFWAVVGPCKGPRRWLVSARNIGRLIPRRRPRRSASSGTRERRRPTRRNTASASPSPSRRSAIRARSRSSTKDTRKRRIAGSWSVSRRGAASSPLATPNAVIGSG